MSEHGSKQISASITTCLIFFRNILDSVLDLLRSLKSSESNEDISWDIVADDIFWLSIQLNVSFINWWVRLWRLNCAAIFNNRSHFIANSLQPNHNLLFSEWIVISIEDEKSSRVPIVSCKRHTQNSYVVTPLISRDTDILLSYQLLRPRVYQPGGEWEI